MSFISHVRFCTSHDESAFVPFDIESVRVGSVRKDHIEVLTETGAFAREGERLVFSESAADSPFARTGALAQAAAVLSEKLGVPLTGEIYPVVRAWGDEPLATLDRAALPWFGLKGFGVHVNGYVRKNNEPHLWIATRAATRGIDPGKLDTMIGGGVPLGLTIEENLIKEAHEEAGLNETVAARARKAGVLSYKRDMMKGVRNDSLFVFDLELPIGLVPECTDGEVERFDLVPVSKVASIVEKTSCFKFNCSLVLIDFFLRHGMIARAHPEYGALTKAMTAIRSAPSP